MNQLFSIDILDFIFKGIVIGIAASAPMGPVGILCVQRTLNKGRWYGFVTGVGAAISDIIYALLTGLGMSFVMDFINDPTRKFVLQLSGSVILLLFGIYSFRSDPMRYSHKGSGKNGRGTLLHNGVTAFLVCFANPLIVFLFMALFAQFAFIVPSQPIKTGVGFLCIIGGALLWWYTLTWLIDKIRARFDMKNIRLINQIIGGAVIIFSLLALVGTIFNLYTL